MLAVNDSHSPIAVSPRVPALLRDLIHEHTGIFFEPERFDTLLDKLRDRAQATGCRTYLDYYYLLKYEERGPAEWLRVMDTFSVQETYFWREAAQIKALVDVVVPAWFQRHKRLPLHIWSAACATGEEPASLAIALQEAGWADRPIYLHASDASESALAKARAGLYRERAFRSLSPALREKYFDPVTPEGSRLRHELLLPIAYQRANLVVPGEIGHRADAPVIFCRNVFIYFSPEAIRRTVASFAERMPPDGHLFVGASESLQKLTTDFDLRELGGASVYVRHSRIHA